jgi:hypothetical protein
MRKGVRSGPSSEGILISSVSLSLLPADIDRLPDRGQEQLALAPSVPAKSVLDWLWLIAVATAVAVLAMGRVVRRVLR